MSKLILPFALIILDGWGHLEAKENNAIAEANTPNFDALWKNYPHSVLNASSGSVGLPEGQMGNSEVGHMTIGAGTIIDTDLVRIAKAINANEFLTNPAFVKLFHHIKKYNSTLHIKGLLSPGGVHSHSAHLYAFLNAAKQAGITQIALHTFLDGRDTAPTSASQYLAELEDVLDDIGIGHIASISGRFWAMDRDNNWDRLKKVEQAIFEADAPTKISNLRPSEVLKNLYSKGVVDELLEPVVFLDSEKNTYPVRENDGVFFFNFRADRARQLSSKITEYAKAKNICFVTLTQYDPQISSFVAFPPIPIVQTLAGIVSDAGLTQVHIAETEKYAHVTYYLNGGQELPHKNEHHILIESHKDVLTHDLAPEMRACEIADTAIAEIEKGTQFLAINFANADMVGHTGNRKAIHIAVETVDRELGRVVDALRQKNGCAFITADHGNAEVNVHHETGEKHTAHTINPVPAILTVPSGTLKNGTLADITPTILPLMGLSTHPEMKGKNLYTMQN
jgi:2,3-bisphosphoglycerate-independent phosphoglycerate mutase